MAHGAQASDKDMIIWVQARVLTGSAATQIMSRMSDCQQYSALVLSTLPAHFGLANVLHNQLNQRIYQLLGGWKVNADMSLPRSTLSARGLGILRSYNGLTMTRRDPWEIKNLRQIKFPYMLP